MTRTIKKSLSAAAHAERLYQGRVAAMNAAASPPASALSSASPRLSSASPLSELWLDGSPASKSPTETRKKASPKKKKKTAVAAAAAATRRHKSSSSGKASSRKRKASPAIQQHSDRAAQRIAGLPSPQRKALLARLAAFKARSHSPSQSPPRLSSSRMRLGTAEPSPAPYPSSSSPTAAKGTELSVTGVTQQFDRARTAVQSQQHAKKVAAAAAAAATAAAKTTKKFVKGYDYVAATDQVYTVSAVRPHPDAIEHYVVLTNYKGKTQTHQIDVQYDEDAGYTITVDGKTYAHTPLFKSENDTTPLKQPLHKMKQALREQTLRNFILYHIKHA